jgi:hypothetical protein
VGRCVFVLNIALYDTRARSTSMGPASPTGFEAVRSLWQQNDETASWQRVLAMRIALLLLV